MNKTSKNNLLSCLKDSSLHIHTSMMMAKLTSPTPAPKEWIWVIRLPSKLRSVHPEDDTKFKEYSEHSEKSLAYWRSSSLLSSRCYTQPYCAISSHIFICCSCCSDSSLHPSNPSLFLTCILEGLFQVNRTQQNTVQSNFTKDHISIQNLSLFSLIIDIHI